MLLDTVKQVRKTSTMNSHTHKENHCSSYKDILIQEVSIKIQYPHQILVWNVMGIQLKFWQENNL